MVQVIREKYDNLDDYIYDVIAKNVESILNVTQDCIKYKDGGYKPYKNVKTSLHNSIIALNDIFNAIYSRQFYISSIVKLEDLFAYYVYVPENNLIIEIFCETSYNNINISFKFIEKKYNKEYAEKILNKIKNPKWPASEDAVKYTTAFYNSINENLSMLETKMMLRNIMNRNLGNKND